ncbi:hypothetical protein HHL19_30375 [Streptomyces sp. R302]|uniref:hypothetical protein n=1 Tax=unclassified Streptomyces TaxID=2593676 RepID=UPI00145DF86C|nr:MULTISPECIES: hypothetical protein [unclassified Streptomyces]NML53166.1 hypothetical protein [Streptomyces sp. R301]NML82849.1 hypothetical protein [Streptomyces sp. R302]
MTHAEGWGAMTKKLVWERGSGRVRRGAVALTGGLLLAAATTACAGAESAKAGEAVSVEVQPASVGKTTGAAPAVMMTRAADAPLVGLYAHLAGTLVVTEGDCVGVKAAQSGELVPIGWGHGWSAREENGRTAVYDADGRLLGREGDRVGLGGGFAGGFDGHPCATGQVFSANDSQATRG